MNPVRTPCIGICSTTSFGDRICRGCKRFNFEVIDWNRYSEEEKLAVMRRIDQFTARLLESKFRIVAPAKLVQVMEDFRFFYDPARSPYCWLHGLLQKYSHRITGLEEIGVELTPQFRGCDVRDVLLQVNEELLTLSEAHFERYFQRT